MFPEAGGSSSFARHTFNEFVSFGAGWALMLDYIITIAISAFFVPNYLAAFWPILKTWPYNSMGGIAVIVFLVVINIFGIKEAARLNIVLAIADLSTQVLLAVVGLFVFLSPRLLITQIHFGTAPTLQPVHLRHLDRHRGLHRHRDDLQHGRGVVQPGARRAARRQVRAARRARRVLRDLDGRPVGHAGPQQRRAGLRDHPQDHPSEHHARPRPPGADRTLAFHGRPQPEGLRAAQLHRHRHAVGQADRQGLPAERPARHQALRHAARLRSGRPTRCRASSRTCPTAWPGCASSWRPGSLCWQPPS